MMKNWNVPFFPSLKPKKENTSPFFPLDENGDNDDGQVFLYRFIDNGEDAEPDLENIEDDQEFERVSNAFNELMEEQDFADIDLDELED